jgi:hypothetical protein
MRKTADGACAHSRHCEKVARLAAVDAATHHLRCPRNGIHITFQFELTRDPAGLSMGSVVEWIAKKAVMSVDREAVAVEPVIELGPEIEAQQDRKVLYTGLNDHERTCSFGSHSRPETKGRV